MRKLFTLLTAAFLCATSAWAGAANAKIFLADGVEHATLNRTQAASGTAITLTPDEGYQITSFAAYNNYAVRFLDGTGDITSVSPQVTTLGYGFDVPVDSEDGELETTGFSGVTYNTHIQGLSTAGSNAIHINILRDFSGIGHLNYSCSSGGNTVDKYVQFTCVPTGESLAYTVTEGVYSFNMVATNVTIVATVGPIPDSSLPLTFEAVEAGATVTYSVTSGDLPAVEYSTDGSTWNTYSEPITLAAVGDKVSFRGNNATYKNTSSRNAKFSCSEDCYIYGNIMSLVDAENYATATTLTGTYTFCEMFNGNTHIKNHASKDLVLPATTLASNCYQSMFRSCTSLTRAPALPATTLANSCYFGMFYGCTGLASAPALPATSLAEYCYSTMFNGCTSLTSAPTLPATTLADRCYSSMFSGCTGLTSASELPATTLADRCYSSMFYGCTSLTSAPALPATSLAQNCYSNMFQGCTGLESAPALPATTLAINCYQYMFQNCTGLESAPTLPATTLANNCYGTMFYGCTALVNAPELPATTLANNCYQYMFFGCTSLSSVTCWATSRPNANTTYNWLSGVATEGTFYAPANSVFDPENDRGPSGIPENWNVSIFTASVATAPTGKNDLVYDETAQTLLETAGTAEYGTMQYRIGTEGEWSEDIPSATDAGTYNVYYKAVGSGIYADSEVFGPIAVTIAQPAASVTVGETTTNYGTFAAALSAWVNNSTLTLLDNVEISSTITISNTRTLDLNGFGIKRTGSGRVFYIGGSGNLTINDSNPDAAHKYTLSDEYNGAGLATLNEASGTITVNGGYITGGNTDEQGAAFYVDGQLTINGGNIIGNHSDAHGGAIKAQESDASVTMNGGRICYNTVGWQGTLTIGDATLRLYGGEISHNRSFANQRWHNGGVDVCGGTFYMHGAPAVFGNYGGNDGNTNQPNDLLLERMITFDGEMTNTTPIGIMMNLGGYDGRTRGQFSFESAYVTNETVTHFTPQNYPGDEIVRIGNSLWVWNSTRDTHGTTSYEVTYDSRGGSAVTGQTVLSGEKASQPETPIKAGTTFDAWYKDALYTEAWDFANNIVSADITLYAHYTNDVVLITVPAAITNLIYTGAAQALVTAGTATGGTVQYSLDGTYWSADPSLGSDAGTYNVYYKVFGDATHTDGEVGGPIVVTIAKAASSVSTPPTAISNLAYTGSAQALVTAGTPTGGTMQYRLGETGDWSDAIPTGTDAGTYNVYYKVVGDANHIDSELGGPIAVTIIGQHQPSHSVVTIEGEPYIDPMGPSGGTMISSDVAYCPYYRYSTTQQLYTSSEIGRAGLIRALAFNVFSADSPYTPEEVKIYLGHTSASTLSESNPITSDQLTLVYSGAPVLGTTTGWERIVFNENGGKFDYNGTQNLVVVISHAASTYKSINYTCIHDTYINMAIKRQSDNNETYGDITDASNYSNGTRPQIQLVIGSNALLPTENMTYTGQPQTLLSAIGVDYGTAYYSLDGNDWSTTIPMAINAGTHPVYYKIVGTGNYRDSIGATPINAYISKALLKVTADDKYVNYGEAAPDFTATITGFVNDETAEVVSGSPTFQCNYTPESTNLYYDIKPIITGMSAANYRFTWGYGKLHVNNVPATLNAAPTASTGLEYSGAPQALLATAGSATNGTMQYRIGTTGEWSSTIPEATNADTYYVYYKVKGASGYSDVEGVAAIEVTIGKIAPAVTAPVAFDTLVYNGLAQTLIVAGEAIGGEMQYSLDGTNWSTALPQGLAAETYTVHFKVAGDANHTDVAEATLDVTIAKAPLTATAENKSVRYGDAIPTYTVTYASWQGTDDENVLTGTIAFACDYAPTSNVGDYAITPSGVTAANYDIAFVQGTVTVSPAPLTITADDKQTTFGEAAPAFTVTIDGFVNGETSAVFAGSLAYACEYIVGGNVGPYTITPSGVSATNYAVSFETGTLTVGQAPASAVAPVAISGLVYDGSAQALVTAGTPTGGTMAYSLNGTDWSDAIPTGTDAGTYNVYYKVVGDANHIDSDIFGPIAVTILGLYQPSGSLVTIEGEASPDPMMPGGILSSHVAAYSTAYRYATTQQLYMSYEIGKAGLIRSLAFLVNGTSTPYQPEELKIYLGHTASDELKKTAPITSDQLTLVYSGSPVLYAADGWETVVFDQAFDYNGTDNLVVVVSHKANSTRSISYRCMWNGDAIIRYSNTYESRGDITDTDEEYDDASRPFIQFVIGSNALLPNKGMTYTGEPQTLLTAIGVDYGTAYYSLDGTDWSTTIPMATTAGAHPVYYKIVGTGNYRDSIGATPINAYISKATLKVKADDQYVNYGEAAPAFTASITGFVNGEDASVVSGAPTFECSYTAGGTNLSYLIKPITTGMSAANYRFDWGYGTLHVSNIPATLNAAPTPAAGLEYTGAAQALLATAGSATNGTMQYRLGATGEWSATLPTATDAGTYAVYYKVKGNSGYSDVEGVNPIEVTIAKSAPTVTAPTAIEGLVYSGVPQVLTTEGSTNDGSIQYSLGDSYWFDVLLVGLEATTHNVYYRVIGDANHTDWEATDPVQVTIAPAPLTVTADAKETIFGEAAPEFTATIDGFVNGETETELSGTLAFACDYTAGDPVNTYAITPSGLSAANYAISFLDGTLTVNKAAATAVAPTVIDNLVYTGLAQTLIAAGSTTDGTMQYSLDGTTWSADLPQATDADTYHVYYKVAGDGNHSDWVAAEPLAVAIAPAPLTVTADDQVTIFNQAAPAFTVTYDGFVNNETETVLSGVLTYACEYTIGDPVGPYTITPSGVTAANYDITFVPGTLTVIPAEVVITDQPTAVTGLIYTGGAQALVSPGAALNGTMYYRLGTTGTWSTDCPTAVNADSYNVYYYVKGDAGFEDSEVFGPMADTIAQAPLTITADNKQTLFGEAAPAFAATITGFVNSETETVLSGALTYACEYTIGDPVGPYTITPSGVTAANYAITYVAGTLSVGKAKVAYTAPLPYDTLVYTAAAQTLVQAGATNDGTFEYSLDSINWSTALPQGINAADYAVAFRIKADANHLDSVAPMPMAVTIAKAPLTVTADNKAVTYGEAKPTYTASYSGFVGGETAAVLGGTLAFACEYEQGSNVGAYGITPSGVTASNYALTFAKGTLTVNKAKVAYTAPLPYDTLVYTAAAQALVEAGVAVGGTMQYSLDGTAWSTDLPQGTNASAYAVHYKVIGDVNHLDSVAPAPVAVAIAKAALTVTADAKTVTYGDAKPTYTATYSGFVGGETAAVLGGTLAFACEYEQGSNVGTYDITPSGVTASNYALTFAKGTLTVNKAASSITTAPMAKTLTYTGAAQALVEAGTPVGGTIEYRLGTGEWGIAIPTATAAGTYVVGYRVIGDANHTDLAEDTINVTIGKATSSVTTAPLAKTLTYSGAAQILVEAGLATGGTMHYSLDGTNWATTLPQGTNASAYAVHYKVVGDANHSDFIAAEPVAVSIAQAALIVTADNKAVIYGDAKPTYTATYSGFVGGETAAVLSGTLAFACDYEQGSNVGAYDITPSGVTAANYGITFVPGTLTVNKAASSITTAPAAKTLTYAGEAQTLVEAGVAVSGTMQYSLDGTAWATTLPQGTNAGAYTVHYKVVGDANHTDLAEATILVTIAQATLTVSGAEVEMAKFADNTTEAKVTNAGRLSGLQGTDVITLTTTAAFSDAAVGEHKTITLSYALTADAALLANYLMPVTSEVYSTEGVILAPMTPDSNAEPQEPEVEVKNGIEVNAYGYCDGNDYSLRYHLSSANPDQYKIDFADSRFTNVAWTKLATAGVNGTIDINIPVDLPTGDYTMDVTFRDSRFTWLESDPISVTFHVNLPETYVVVPFSSVVALVDTCHCLTDIQWYHRNNSNEVWQAIPGANDYYYRQEGGLTGEYFVQLKINGVDTYTCPQTDLTTLYKSDKPAKVRAYPNPVVSTTTVTIEGSDHYEHTLRIVDLMGSEVMTSHFEGDETTVEMSDCPQGNYMISVDGIVVKVMKQ